MKYTTIVVTGSIFCSTQKSLDDTKEVVINPITTTFDYNKYEPTNPSSFSTVNGPVDLTSLYTKAPKPKYIFTKKYGFQTYE